MQYSLHEHLLIRSIKNSSISSRYLTSLDEEERASAASLLSSGNCQIQDENIFLTSKGLASLYELNRLSIENDSIPRE